MRAFVHYKGAGYTVLPSDDEHQGRFDFLIQGFQREFEVECKTFAESIGNPISVDDSIHVFRAFKSAIAADLNFRESGILTLTVPSRMTIPEEELTKIVIQFLSENPAARHSSECSLTFERRPDWDVFVRANDRQPILDDIENRFANHNLHSITMLARQHAVMGVARSERRSRPAKSIFDRLKNASQQFTRQRPAVVWGHFLGFGEDGFKELLEEQRLGHRMLDVFGNYLFKNPNRSHVCRLRLSADGNLSRPRGGAHGIIVPNMIRSSGLAYDLTSRVSMFDPTLTQ